VGERLGMAMEEWGGVREEWGWIREGVREGGVQV